ncbi:MAG: DNA cytosine methyltransferase [Xanthomonadales bacterium]|nr:DNA cytosine methyltransferase [Xanthomonadales bacterium]
MPTFGVVDLFAGPGGLGEGFASLVEDDHAPFRIGISVEKEASAHRTLTLRAFLRAYMARHGTLPNEFIDLHAGKASVVDWAGVDATLWEHARQEARCLELGAATATDALDAAISNVREMFDDTILIGGPPCQAYSLIGRVRSRGTPGYMPERDKRHYLFREYIRVLDRLRPAAFVMENVKGMLSSTVESRLIFEMLMEDLASIGTGRGHEYKLHAVRLVDGVARLASESEPRGFVVRTEDFGVPQRRHRVIIIGIRSDLAPIAGRSGIEVGHPQRSVDDTIRGLPRLRSGITRRYDNEMTWREEVITASRMLEDFHACKGDSKLAQEFQAVRRCVAEGPILTRSATALPADYGNSTDHLLRWLERPELKALAQHETRGHMPSDLRRYLFASVFAKARGYSPAAEDFPLALSPDHRNWHSGHFRDRFRVQLGQESATTVTSHISKDGHYFIHPDPTQCRSLTVREAARLQTFPDDYLFLGNRTQQYVQVGNAVPPWLARQIARLLYRSLTCTNSQLPPKKRESDKPPS